MIVNLLKPGQCATVLKTISADDWMEGKARTKALTGTVKRNHEILDHPALSKIGKILFAHRAVQRNAIPYRIHKPKFSRYSEGQAYGRHTDAPWMGGTRTDLSCTIWLNDDYEGGELVIDGKAYRGAAGQAIVYTCGELHEVRPVTKGNRICAITWIQSRVRDPEKRRLVADLREFLAHFEGHAEFPLGSRVHSGLLRMWSED